MTQILGAEAPVEHLLFESGMTSAINAAGGIYVPILEAVRVDSDAWIIMEDVSEDLDSQDTRTIASKWRFSLISV